MKVTEQPWWGTPWRELQRQSIERRKAINEKKEDPMRDVRAELEECIEGLDLILDSRKRMLETDPYWTRQVKAGYERPSIYEMTDTNGRPLIADVLVAKTQALVTLANMSQGPAVETK